MDPMRPASGRTEVATTQNELDVDGGDYATCCDPGLGPPRTPDNKG